MMYSIYSKGGNIINWISGFKRSVGIIVTIPSALSVQTTEAVPNAPRASLSMSVL